MPESAITASAIFLKNRINPIKNTRQKSYKSVKSDIAYIRCVLPELGKQILYDLLPEIRKSTKLEKPIAESG